MPVWAEVRSSRLEKGIIGAEYYSPYYLALADRLKKSRFHIEHLATCCSLISDGDHSKTQYEESGVRFLLSECIQEMRLRPESGSISQSLHGQLKRTQLEPGDVLLTKTGVYFGKAAVVPTALKDANTSAHVARLVPKEYVLPDWLALFLNSKYGQFQLKRRGIKGTRPEMKLVEMQDIGVPVPPVEIQRMVCGLAKDFETIWVEAESLYRQAGKLLVDELGISTIDLSHSTSYKADLSHVFSVRRWDSEFYKPQRVLIAVLKARKVKIEKFMPVGQVFSYLTNGHTPLHHDLTVGEVPFLTAEHVSDFRIDFSTDKRILQRHHETELARTALRDGDILMTIKGRVGNCAVVRNSPPAANINQDVALIRLRNGIHPYFFAAWFNSFMGKQLVEQRSTGGINPFLGLGNLRGMPFPVLASKDHQRIGDLVQETVEKAHAAERESANLLEQAKRRVEALIERAAAA